MKYQNQNSFINAPHIPIRQTPIKAFMPIFVFEKFCDPQCGHFGAVGETGLPQSIQSIVFAIVSSCLGIINKIII